MSIVGEVGVIISLITGTIEIVKSTKSLHSAYKDAKGLPKEFGSIAAKFPLVLTILRNAEKKGQATKLDDEQTNEAENNIRACHEKVEALNKIFKAVLPDADANRLERYKKAVAAVGKGKRVEELMGEIMKHIELVTCDKLMGTATGDEIKKLEEAIQEMLDMSPSIPEDSGSIIQHSSGSGNNIASRVTNNNIGEGTYTNSNTGKGPQLNNNGAGTFNYHNFSGFQKSITLLQSLYFPEMEHHKKDISEAVEDTCEWLCDEPDYKSWLAQSQSLLWIIGIPGSGKSTLVKYIYEQDTLQTETKVDKQGPPQRAQKKIILVSFFCYSAGAPIQKTRIGLFRSLLHQILRQIPTWPSDLTSEFDKRCELQGEPGIKWEWHERDLKEILEDFMLHIAKRYPEEYILRVYIDALDEFGGNVPNGGEEPMKLAEYFESLTSQDRFGISLNVCISRRDYPFLASGCLKISIGNKNRQDIWTYVQNKIARINGKHYEARELIKWTVEMASGIFQWAVIVVKKAKDLIKGFAPLKHILEFLGDLPEGLDDLYDKSFQNGLLKLVQLIPKPQNDPNSNERQSTADRTIKNLSQRTSNEIDVNMQDFDDRTPLMLAIGGQHEAVVELPLRRSDIQVNRRDAVGFPTLIYAVELGSERELEMLLQHSKVKSQRQNQSKTEKG
ncbi:hypothetical protein VE04_00165 [Pseudogymnoascus sp. 24MN13]|nr:hypothetical protein VE04_00165 [Pseudogymnoascus sp. 24MN13]